MHITKYLAAKERQGIANELRKAREILKPKGLCNRAILGNVMLHLDGFSWNHHGNTSIKTLIGLQYSDELLEELGSRLAVISYRKKKVA